MAAGNIPGDPFGMIAPIFADFSLMKRDFTLSSDLVEDAPYECNKDRKMEMMRSMYFVGADLSKEPEAKPGGPPPEASTHLKDWLKDMWDKCDEMITELNIIN